MATAESGYTGRTCSGTRTETCRVVGATRSALRTFKATKERGSRVAADDSEGPPCPAQLLGRISITVITGPATQLWAGNSIYALLHLLPSTSIGLTQVQNSTPSCYLFAFMHMFPRCPCYLSSWMFSSCQFRFFVGSYIF